MYKLLLVFFICCGFNGERFVSNRFMVELIPPNNLAQGIYQLTRFEGNLAVRDTGYFQDGKLLFKGLVEYPTKANLVLFTNDSNPHSGEADFKNREAGLITFILEPGNIKIDVSEGLKKITFSGSRIQEDYSAYYASINPLYRKSIDRWE